MCNIREQTIYKSKSRLEALFDSIRTKTASLKMETVLIIGATGNIGVSAVKAVLQTGRHVLAAVRNQASADKLFRHVGTKEGITIVEADICSENGVQGIVDLVKAGKLPAFQHVYAAGLSIYSMGLNQRPFEALLTWQQLAESIQLRRCRISAQRDCAGP